MICTLLLVKWCVRWFWRIKYGWLTCILKWHHSTNSFFDSQFSLCAFFISFHFHFQFKYFFENYICSFFQFLESQLQHTPSKKPIGYSILINYKKWVKINLSIKITLFLTQQSVIEVSTQYDWKLLNIIKKYKKNYST